MLQKARGIVLHTLNYSEASVIAHIYTDAFGLQSFLLNGVRKQKAKFNANLLQPLSCIELVAYFKPGKSLHRVAELNASPAFTTIPYDTVKTTIALFLAEVMYRSIREEEKNEGLFEFIYNSVLYLDHQQQSFHLFHLLFMVKLSRFLGFYPKAGQAGSGTVFDLREGIFTNQLPLHADIMDAETGNFLTRLLESNLDTLDGIYILPAQRKILLKDLVTYYELHQTHGFQLRSLPVLEEVLS